MQRGTAQDSEPRGSADRLLVLLVLSLTLNLIIGQGIWRHFRTVPQTPVLTAEKAASPAPSTRQVGSLKTAAKSTDGGRFVWSMLQSADSKMYAERLRAAECPPAVIRRIITSQLFEQREEALARIPPPPFWSTPSERLAARVKRFHEALEIMNQFDLMAWETVGIRLLDKPSDLSELLLKKFIIDVLANFATPSAREEIIAVADRMEWLDRGLGELPCLSSYREDRKLLPWREAQFNSMMSSAQQHEFKKRFVALSFMFSSQLEGFRFTGPELEKVCDWLARGIRLAEWHPNDDMLHPVLKEAVQASVDPKRFTEFQCATDRDFRQLVENMGKDNPGVRENALQFYEAKQPYDRAWNGVLEDDSLSEEQKAHAIDQLRSEQTALAREIFGEKLFPKLTNSPAYWLYNAEEQPQ